MSRLHRFFVDPEDQELSHNFWLKDERLYNQWTKVLRYRMGEELVLFDGVSQDRLYKIEKIADDAIHLDLITEFERKLPERHVYLFFSLLKKDKNDWVLQKCTELGVRNFIPMIAARSEKTGFNIDRAHKIVIEAAEQCGRSDIPQLREPVLLETAINDYKDKIKLLVSDEELKENRPQESGTGVGIFIGPEGGWSDEEKVIFDSNNIGHFHLGKLTLRAETASVIAAAKLLD